MGSSSSFWNIASRQAVKSGVFLTKIYCCLHVPQGHVWVQGDYTHNSGDWRTFGPIPYALIQGRVLWRVWPFQDFGPTTT